VVVRLMVFSVLFYGFIFSQDLVRAVGECLLSPDMTLERARKIALDEARAEAIRQVAGVKVQSEILRIESERRGNLQRDYYELFSSLNTSVSFGRIVEERIIQDTIVFENVDGRRYFVYRVEIEARVVKEDDFDPGFWIDLELNRDTYRDGEEIVLYIEPSKDCYVTIFNVLYNDSVIVIMPNRYVGELYLKGGQRYRFPPEGAGYKLVASLGGYERLVESILVIGTRDRYEFSGVRFEEYSVFGFIPTYKGAVVELMKWLSRIPGQRRASASRTYEIVR